ncbi:MAG: alpha/beta hydrolase [Parvibaculum sp.]|uniref:alpha/beta fold hydrolase n=1 Tax=Parvibaculum sp. TaxID=2024848 RepID=UPI0025EA5FD5|nr:alpha/beta hydrolase [Parvibaculum sp.]MCE9648907.1 alpha/beta hydrolase [Parvibaculum sp.]
MNASSGPAAYRELFYTSQDGLRLFSRDYGQRGGKHLPVICLPGLTRNSKDFETLATRISATRRVLCPDLRGRGRSQYCESWSEYTPQNEMLDVFDLMGAAGIHQAVFIGTSRGGIVTMLMAAQRPNAVRGAVLNDIGPEVSIDGLKRIASYAGVMEAPASWTEAAFKLRMMNERDFPTLTGEDWYEQARRTFAEEAGVPKIDYDGKIGLALRKGLEAANGALPAMWPQFKALGHVPALVIRGENSDILSADTVKRMEKEHAGLASVSIKDRGHVPFLDEPEAIGALDAFLERC